MGEVTPGRPIRRHCHYKHPSGKWKGTTGQGISRHRQREAQQSLSRPFLRVRVPQLITRLTYLLRLFSHRGLRGVKVRWMDGPLGGGIQEGRSPFRPGSGLLASVPLRLSDPLVCRACLSSSWISKEN